MAKADDGGIDRIHYVMNPRLLVGNRPNVGNTVGNATFSFSDASHATFSYTVDGITSQSKAVVRQPF